MPDASLTLPPGQRDGYEDDPLARPLPTRTDVMLEWLAGQPLVPPAIGLVIGIVIDASWAVPVPLAAFLFIAAGAAIVLFRTRDGLRHLALMLAALAVGAVLHDSSFRRWPADHVVRYCGPGATPVRLTGTVIASPAIRPVQSGRINWFNQLPRTRLLVAAEKIEGVSGDIHVSGTVAVHVREPVLHVAAGDRVELFGRMYRPAPPMNPGEKDWALASRRNGILVEMSCEHAANVVVHAIGDRGHRWMAVLRQRLRAAMLDHTFPGDVPGSRLLSALVLGQRSEVNAKLNEAFVNTGTVHYLSVSGAHVGMLASAVWLVGLLVGGSRRACAACAFAAVTAYAIVAEPRPAILRAALMADLLCLALLLRRPVRSANWLALAAIILLIAEPTQLFSPGFQMSFLTLVALLYLSPRLHDAAARLMRRLLGRDDPLLAPAIQQQLNPPSPGRVVVNWVTHVLGWWLAMSVSAWTVGAALGTCHFQRLAVWGWLNSILIMPLVWLTLVTGFVKALLSLAVPSIATLLGWPLALITETLVVFVQFLARLPGAGMPAPAVPGWLTAAGLAVLAFWVLRPWLRIARYWVAVAAFAFITSAAWQLAPPFPGDTLRLDVLSVGNGTACVIGLPNGRTFIYDIGSMPPYDIERWRVGPLLARRRAYRIDAVILSHPNLDHFSGLPDLLDHRSVKAVIAAPHFERLSKPGSAGARLLADVRQHGIPRQTVVRGDRLNGTGNVEIEVLWPPPLDELSIARANDSSIVLGITYAGCRVLLCGDIEELPQRQLLAMGNLKADVLVLPHHGGVEPNTGAFLEAVDPAYCIRSSGQRDVHTYSGLLDLVAHRQYFNTADDGAVEIRVTPSELTVRPWRPVTPFTDR